MLIHIRNVLTPEVVNDILGQLDQSPWGDGRETAGYLSSRVKDNAQLPATSPLTRKLGNIILDALDGNQQFISAALPLKVVPPLFNRHAFWSEDFAARANHMCA